MYLDIVNKIQYDISYNRISNKLLNYYLNKQL